MNGRVAMQVGMMVCTTAVVLWAQSNREAYRAPFETWQGTEPDLERTAGDPGPDFAAQVQRTSDAATAYLRSRQAFLAEQVRTEEQARWAGQPFIGGREVLATRPEVRSLMNTTTDQLTATITTFASVRDPAIQQVRQAMERERAALNALNESMNTREATLRELKNKTEDAELLREAVGQGLAIASAGRARIAEHIDRESTAWNAYYKTLVEGAMSTEPAPGAAGVGAASVKPLAPKPSPAGLPLSRYVGGWIFQDKKLFFGAQPETVELLVREEEGRMSGTLSARFILPAGTSGDPVLKLDFQGLVQQTRNQVFPLRTAEGVGGTIELIPGTAFNLLEVNLQIEPTDNKVRSTNFVLLKR
jgi:hypothetical protein